MKQTSFPIRLLLVEDEAALAEELEAAAGGATNGPVEVRVAPSATEARAALEDEEFDLVVYDLGDGLELFRSVSEEHPGVPVVVVATPDDLGVVSELMAAGRKEDLFGTDSEEAMVSFFPSDRFAECVAAVRGLVRGMGEVAALPVEPVGQLELSTGQRRAIQIFTRQTEATRARVTGLSGGLSGAKTVVVDTSDENGMRTAHVVGKLAPIDSIPAAVEGYENATPDLPAGLGAAMAGVVSAGAGDVGAIFFRLADDFHRTWFSCLADAPQDAAAAARRLHDRFASRYPEAPVEALSLGEIRRSIITDEELATATGPVPSIGPLEATRVEVRHGIQHRDLHGLNVLVSDSNEPLLIDYDNYAAANCAVDPVTLELSAIFHRDERAQLARKGWPSVEQARCWFDLDAYLEGCPYPEAIRACRDWAEAAGASRRELAATLISAALRQFWFDNTDKQLAAAMMEAGESALRH